MTFYLKYRPQTLEDLDQEGPRKLLQKIVEKKENIPHAILLSGPKGTGKTSTARILAKIVNCEKPSKNGAPCNNCEMCKSITRGENMDVIELDAASHRGIEDIRTIKDAVKLSPARAKKKVYIIDEAHMLTTEASNALLKTLEEPPSHVMFIMATTNPEKLIDTVRSRSTNIYFKKASINELSSSLEKIAKGEGIKPEKGVLEIVAEASDGSFRDASKIFEQLVAETSDFTLENVEKLLTNKKIFDIDDFIFALESKDTKKAIMLIESAVDNGAQVKDLNALIIERLRILLLAKVGLESDKKSKLNETELIQLTKLFSESYSKIANSYIDQLPVELSIIEYCGDSISVDSKKDEENKREIKAPGVSKVEIKTSEVIVEESKVHEETIKVKVSKIPTNGEPFKSEIWSQVLALLRPSHASTEALLRAAQPLDYDGKVLRLGVYYKFHKEHLESISHRTILEETLASFLGNTVKVICILTDPSVTPAINDGFANTGGGVLLTEPQMAPKVTNPTLTTDGGEDIISIAEKIFNN